MTMPWFKKNTPVVSSIEGRFPIIKWTVTIRDILRHKQAQNYSLLPELWLCLASVETSFSMSWNKMDLVMDNRQLHEDYLILWECLIYVGIELN